MVTQYEWEGRIYFPNDTVHRVKKDVGNILVPKNNPSGSSGGGNTSGGSGGSGGGNVGGGGSPNLNFQINPVTPSTPINPPVGNPPSGGSSGGGSSGSGSTAPLISPYPMIAPNGQPIFGSYQVFTVAHNGQNVIIMVPVTAGYRLLQTATGWQVQNNQGQVIWST